MSTVSTEAQAVLDFWYPPDKPQKEQAKVWFGGKELDGVILEKFNELIEKARTGQLKAWEDNPKSALAHILLIDQFCRNAFRGTAKSFDCDPVSLGVAKRLIASGRYKELAAKERMFLLLPYMHSESIDDQNTSVKLHEEFVEDYKGAEGEDIAKNGLSYAKLHKEVIDKFGRFPKRNAALGRENTPEEEELFKNYPYPF